jgi:hypothetical protein
VTNLQKLRILGEALYGPRFMRAIARDLGVNYRTVLRWDGEQFPVGDKIIAELIVIAKDRKNIISKAIMATRHMA